MTAPVCLGAGANASRASAWVKRWSHLVRPGGTVLDVACGEGRHLAWFASLGHRVVGVDRSASALAGLGLPPEVCTPVLADIEQGPWPLPGQTFDAVVVTHYLWRPLLPTLLSSLAEGGVLIYETFATGQASVGRPTRAEFLLQPGELMQVCASLRTVAFEDGFEPATAATEARYVQRITAVREVPAAPDQPPRRHPLS